ncbi:DUF305 domain-containing protein [Micromonospora maritima]|uniref:DUF305 domain-containing protein n=1 Tax=Micromonospora maritima TaxID=986711 RepID=A0ABW7ZGX9_9ACTN
MVIQLRPQRVMQPRTVVRAAVAGILVAVLALSAGCSDGNAGASGAPGSALASGALPPKATGYPMASPAAHNAGDLRFAEDLLSHRRQAIAMTEMAGRRATEDQVMVLADGLRQTYLADLRELTSLLQGWGVHLDVSGSPAAEQALRVEPGGSFDRAFLAALIRNTQESVQIAERHKALAAASGPTRQIATDTASSGTALLVTMRRMVEDMGT